MRITFTPQGRVLLLVACLGLTAVANANDMTTANEKLAIAKSSVQRAEQAGAPQSASIELASARDKLNRAAQQIAQRDYKTAIRLAEQADMDARVAEATADQQRAHKAAAEFDASLDALRQEATRSAAPAQ